MEIEPTAGGGRPKECQSGPLARWIVLALLAPFVGFLGGCLAAAMYGGHPMSNGILGVRIFGVFCALGLLAGVIAGTRHERLWGVTALAIVLNALGVLGLAAFWAPLWN